MFYRYSFLIIFFCLLGSILIAQNDHADTRDLKVGEVYSDSLEESKSQKYKLKLDSGEFVFGHALQKTVDVEVIISDPSGKRVAEFDQPARGKEIFQFESEANGAYIIEIVPFKKESGEYDLIVSQVAEIASDPAKRVDQLFMAYIGNDAPGAEVMVMKDGDIILSRAYGMANLTHGIPFETDTRTNIGSTSKQFTAMAVALLADRGLVSWDDNVRKHIPELPEFEHEVKLKHLVSHTSGYREFLNLLAMSGRNLASDLEREKIIELVQRQPELQNVPGEEWNYNNTAFVLLAEVVERVTDTPFEEWVDENIFQPLEMDNSLMRSHQSIVVPNSAQGYRVNKQGDYIESTDLAGAAGAGGIYTTLDDLAKWIRNFNDPKVGNKGIIENMTTPFVLNTGDTTLYGMGLFIQDYKEQKVIQHGGADVAHRSMLMYFPGFDGAVVTQSNSANFNSSMAYKVADLYFKEHFTKKEKKKEEKEKETSTKVDFAYDAEKFDPLAEKYELAEVPGFILTFKRDGEKLFTQATGQPEVELQATSDSTFQIKGIPAKLTFHLNEDGSADSLTLHQNGEHIAYKVDWSPKVEDLEDYTGPYFSEEIETYFTVVLEDSSLVMQHYQMDDIELEAGDKDSFSGGFPITEINFIRGDEGEIKGFSASSGRTTNVFFEKLE